MDTSPVPLGQTSFAVEDDRVVITRTDQPICRVPLADLLGFAESYSDAPGGAANHSTGLSGI